MSEPGHDPSASRQWVCQRARDLGFDLAGIAPARASEHADYLLEWLASGQAGTMQWMHNHLEKRLDVRQLLPGARSVICVAANYHFTLDTPPDDAPRARIARYALGEDYHEVFKRRLHQLADDLRGRCPGAQTKCGVDSSPILESELAAAAGLGWIGKNTCILHPRLGSWLFLGEVITTVELSPDRPMANHCGTCTRCIDACPTGAITAPYRLDARKCISYLNIEHKGELSEQQQGMLGDWLVGCDICQDVCPFNRKAPEGTIEELRPRLPDGTVRIDEVLAMDDVAYRTRFRGSPIRRVKLPVLQANARAILRNKTAGRS